MTENNEELYCINCYRSFNRKEAVTHHFADGVKEYYCPICNLKIYPPLLPSTGKAKIFGFDSKKDNKIPKPPHESDVWENDFEKVDICCNMPVYTIIITGKCYLRIQSVMDTQKNREWLAYLQGTIEEDKPEGEDNGNHEIIYKITHFTIPAQVVSTASVDVIDGELPNNCIGVIHSHHSMGAFMSGTDNDWINSNHNLSIVIAKDGMKAHVRFFPPCGNGNKYFVIEPKVDISLPDVDTSNIESFESRRSKRVRGLTQGEINKEQEVLPFDWR